MGTVWEDTEGLTDELKRLHAQGRHGILDITKILSRDFKVKLTKNAVIGKLHRLKLYVSRMAQPKPKPKPAPKRKPKPEPKVETVEFIPPPSPIASRNLSLFQLTSSTCKFPTSGYGESCRFCGHKSQQGTIHGFPYCRYHNSIATQPPPVRRHRGHIR